MGPQINTHVAALNAYRNLNGTQNSMQTSLERLSSGLRINRAADDAAGLAISQKLRSQVNGLNQAQANAQDGVSLIQTAEGALNETHSIPQRMSTLAVQSASDTNTNTNDDRAQIQKESTPSPPSWTASPPVPNSTGWSCWTAHSVGGSFRLARTPTRPWMSSSAAPLRPHWH